MFLELSCGLFNENSIVKITKDFRIFTMDGRESQGNESDYKKIQGYYDISIDSFIQTYHYQNKRRADVYKDYLMHGGKETKADFYDIMENSKLVDVIRNSNTAFYTF